MSRYAVYELFNNSRAPNNLESCGHLAGVLIEESDKNPLNHYNRTYHVNNLLDEEVREKGENSEAY